MILYYLKLTIKIFRVTQNVATKQRQYSCPSIFHAIFSSRVLFSVSSLARTHFLGRWTHIFQSFCSVSSCETFYRHLFKRKVRVIFRVFVNRNSKYVLNSLSCLNPFMSVALMTVNWIKVLSSSRAILLLLSQIPYQVL